MPYESPGARRRARRARARRPTTSVTPIDVGDVCVNYSKAAFPDASSAPRRPRRPDRPEASRTQFVTENPETSSPGFAFLLATIAKYGEDGWEDYWQRPAGQRRRGHERLGGGLQRAVFGRRQGDALDRHLLRLEPGGRGRSTPTRRSTEPPTGVVADACFRQIEFAGVLRGTEHPEAAAQLVDFLLSPTFQEDIPLNMFVEPGERDGRAARRVHRAPHRDRRARSRSTPAEIEAGRDDVDRAVDRDRPAVTDRRRRARTAVARVGARRRGRRSPSSRCSSPTRSCRSSTAGSARLGRSTCSVTELDGRACSWFTLWQAAAVDRPHARRRPARGVGGRPVRLHRAGACCGRCSSCRSCCPTLVVGAALQALFDRFGLDDGPVAARATRSGRSSSPTWSSTSPWSCASSAATGRCSTRAPRRPPGCSGPPAARCCVEVTLPRLRPGDLERRRSSCSSSASRRSA